MLPGSQVVRAGIGEVVTQPHLLTVDLGPGCSFHGAAVVEAKDVQTLQITGERITGVNLSCSFTLVVERII